MIELIPERSRYVGRDGNGAQHIRGELISDTCAELAGVTSVNGAVLEFGSLAFCGKDGEICAYMSDSKWYKVSDGSEVTAE